MRIGVPTRASRFEAAMVLALCAAVLQLAAAPFPQDADSRHNVEARTPVTRTLSYRVNGKVRPFLFWIGRDEVGEAFITWRHSTNGRRGFDLLIGSDPKRAPRDINRWGFIAEEFGEGQATIVGVMKESNEQTLDEAEAKVMRKEHVSVFKAARTTITESRAETGTFAIRAPATLTYRDVDALLKLIAGEPSRIRTTDIPPGTQAGFLIAMDSLIRASLKPCGRAGGTGTKSLGNRTVLYNQTLYDLTLVSCNFQPELQTKLGAIADVVDGRFRLRNRTTNHDTSFRVFYGASGEFRELPLRVVFRPRWWIELEMEIASVVPGDGSKSTSGLALRKDGS